MKIREWIANLEPGDVEPYDYDRTMPFFGRDLAARGYALPLPYGVSLLINNNLQAQSITDGAVALAKDMNPPKDADLVELPFVFFDDVESDTISTQLKVDTWLFPFLNVYGLIGLFDSDVDLRVRVDLDEFLGPPVCRPNNHLR